MARTQPGLPVGGRLYLDQCSACYFVSGKGAAGIGPGFQGIFLATGLPILPLVPDLLPGTQVEGTEKRPMDLVMQV